MLPHSERCPDVAKVNFTAARVEAHHCPRGQFTRTGKPIDQAFLWDAKTPGLGLRATVSGAKTYIFQAKLNGSTVRVTIGDPPTLDKAQKAARDLQQLVDDGKDPREVRAEQRTARETREAEALR